MTSAGGPIGFLMIALAAPLCFDQGRQRPSAVPTSLNLGAICQKRHCHPRYIPIYFPRSGTSHFVHRGKSINRLESWYSLCCGKPEEEELWCIQQAWSLFLSKFCEEEFSTKTLVCECFEYKGEARWSCFDSDLPNQDYSCVEDYIAPTMSPEPGFTFNQRAC